MTQRWRRQRAANRSSGGGYWKPKDGENIIRIFPFQHTVQPYDIACKRYPEIPVEADDPKVGDTIEEFFAVSRRHFKTLDGKSGQCGLLRAYDGSWFGTCPTCDMSRQLFNGTDDDKKAARNFRAQTKYVLVVCDVESDEKSFSIWDAPSSIVDFVFASMDKKKYAGESLLGFSGRDLTFVYDSKSKTPQGYYTGVEWMDRGQEVLLDASQMGDPPDLLSRKQYVPTAYHHLFPLNEVKQEEDPAPAPKEEPKEEPKAEKKPRRKAAAKKPEPEPEPTPSAEIPSMGDLKQGDTIFYMDDDKRVSATVADPTPDDDGFFRVKAEDGEEYEIQHEELVA